VWVAAIGAGIGAIVVWELAVIAVLRLFHVNVPFSLVVHIHPRREHELLAALGRRRKHTFVFISGFLMFACPFLVGLAAGDYVIDGFPSHSTHGFNHDAGSVSPQVVIFG